MHSKKTKWQQGKVIEQLSDCSYIVANKQTDQTVRRNRVDLRLNQEADVSSATINQYNSAAVNRLISDLNPAINATDFRTEDVLSDHDMANIPVTSDNTKGTANESSPRPTRRQCRQLRPSLKTLCCTSR